MTREDNVTQLRPRVKNDVPPIFEFLAIVGFVVAMYFALPWVAHKKLAPIASKVVWTYMQPNN